MNHDDAAAVVFVRAVEDVLPDRIPPENLLDAHIAAGDPSEGAQWIARRACYLIDHCLGPYTAVLSRLQLTANAWFFIGLAMAGGLASNYLGPSTKIHVIWNPMVILIAWNALVYAGLAISSAFVGQRKPLMREALPSRPNIAPQISEVTDQASLNGLFLVRRSRGYSV